MLSVLSISMWSARKHDPEASVEIAQRHGAQPDAGRYHSAAQGDGQEQILRGVYPERTAEILLPRLRDQDDSERDQNDSEWAQDDGEGLRMTTGSADLVRQGKPG
jgi:hypothetical protein